MFSLKPLDEVIMSCGFCEYVRLGELKVNSGQWNSLEVLVILVINC